MDGDLQHDPEDIPAFLLRIDEGYDIASGWRTHRIDNPVTRKFPSRVANWLIKRASGVQLHDFGTTFKAYRAEVLKDINLYGEFAPLHPGACIVLRSACCGGTHSQRAQSSGRFSLWVGSNLQRDVRYLHGLVSFEIFHEANAFLRKIGFA